MRNRNATWHPNPQRPFVVDVEQAEPRGWTVAHTSELEGDAPGNIQGSGTPSVSDEQAQADADAGV